MRYRRTRRDENHAAVVQLLRQHQISTQDLVSVGDGCPDVLAGKLRNNGTRVNVLLEIKNPKRRTKGDNAARTLAKQEQWRAEWNGQCAVVSSPEEALAVVLAA